MSRPTENLTGRTFGLLTVIAEAPKRGNIKMWKCTRCSALSSC